MEKTENNFIDDAQEQAFFEDMVYQAKMLEVEREQHKQDYFQYMDYLKERGAKTTYEHQLFGIIDVNTNDTHLDPNYVFMTLDYDDFPTYDFKLPETFNCGKYRDVICDLAVAELVHLLEAYPETKCQYVQGSACIKNTADIESDYIQNQRCGMFQDIDMFCFKVKTELETTTEELQKAFNKLFVDDWEHEYWPNVEIYRVIGDKYMLEDFL